MAALKLAIGNKNYSSWSMRPWLALRANDIPFVETLIPLYTDNPADKEQILSFSRAGKVPVLVDAGVGTASDATIAMELGCEAVLMNSAIAEAQNPVLMARAMQYAVEAGRLAYLAGRMPKKLYASASSPLTGLIN